jgi:hypothetical protein
MLTILLVILLILALGGLPQAGFHSLGYAPTSVVTIVLVVLVVLLLSGRL